MASPLRIGLIGFGNIGSGVIKTLQENRELLDERCPRPLRLCRVADLDLESERPVEIDRGLLTTETLEVVTDPNIDVIVELIGGLEPARTFVETAIRAGKHVVTANKALLANQGAELLALAAENNVRLLFEAAVGGGIPVVRVLTECLAANRITRIEGILNGTCNFILTEMAKGQSYETALKRAQELGYAEPDPTADVEGMDAANKIAILASLAFGYDIRYDDVDREGIANLTMHDLRDVQSEGHASVKHLAVAEIEDGAVAVGVRPAILTSHPLQNVEGVTNGVVLKGWPVESIVLIGPGAGPGPTSSAVLSDLMWLSQLEVRQKPEKPFLTIPAGRKPEEGELENLGYRLRIHLDRGYGLTDVAEILQRHEIPVTELWESGRVVDESGDLPVTIMTVEAGIRTVPEEAMQAVVEEIRQADLTLSQDSVLALPVIDGTFAPGTGSDE